MAENEESQEESAPKSGKGGSKKLIIIIAAAVLVVVIIVVVLLMLMSGGNEEAQAAPAQQQVAQQAAPAPAPVPAAPAVDMSPVENTGAREIGAIFQLDPFSLNLADPTGITYIRVAFNLEYDPKNSDLAMELESKIPLIKDLIIVIVSSKSLEEISTAQGKTNLRTEITRRLNASLVKGKIVTVYLTEFVVQKG